MVVKKIYEIKKNQEKTIYYNYKKLLLFTKSSFIPGFNFF